MATPVRLQRCHLIRNEGKTDAYSNPIYFVIVYVHELT